MELDNIIIETAMNETVIAFKTNFIRLMSLL